MNPSKSTTMHEAFHEIPLFNEFPDIPTSRWMEVITQDLKGADFEKKLIWKTYEGFPLRPFYRAEDLSFLSHLDVLPGEAPYIRGQHTHHSPWEIRQDISSTDPATIHSMIRELTTSGVEGIGINASRIMALEDLEQIFDGIDVSCIAIHFYGAPSYPHVLEIWFSYLTKKGYDTHSLKGSFYYDPIGEMLDGKKHDFQWDTISLEAASLVRRVSKDLPGYKAIMIQGQAFHNAGSSLVQELAYGLGMANEYLAALSGHGLEAGLIAKVTGFTFAVGSSYFLEIAKLRAARWLWSRILDQYTQGDTIGEAMYIHSVTALWNKTLYDPYVNLLRSTTEAMAAALAGSNSITVLPFDVVYREDDPISHRIARNQQIILREEAYLSQVADPSAGSYYIESITDVMAHEAWKLFQQVESAGGFLLSFSDNIIQDAIEKLAHLKKADIVNRKTTVLGTNQYPNPADHMSAHVSEAYAKKASEDSPVRALQPSRASEELERIRLATEAAVNGGRKLPAVFLFTIGNPGMRRARATFAANFFGCGGYAVIDNPGFTTVEEGCVSFRDSGADILVLCSSDDEYPALVPALQSEINKVQHHAYLVLAGHPGEMEDIYRTHGVQSFIHVRVNMLDALTHFHQILNISL